MRNLPFLNVSSKKDRMIVAFITSIVAGVGLGFAYAFILAKMNINTEYSIVFVALGYLVGEAIKFTSKGVTNEIRIIGAIGGLICFFSADIFNFVIRYGFNFTFAVRLTIQSYTYLLENIITFNSFINSLLSVLFRVVCVFTAYNNSTISFER